MRTVQLTADWIRCSGSRWCPLLTLNLDHTHFDGLEGVYVIFQGGPNAQVLRVGQGLIRERLRAHWVDPALLAYRRLGLYVTWAQVHARHRDGVERFLADTYRPPLGERYPNVPPIPVNLPGE